MQHSTVDSLSISLGWLLILMGRQLAKESTFKTFLREYSLRLTDLLMVLDPHAQSVDQDGDHNPTTKVFAVHDLAERVAHQPPEADHVCRRLAQPQTLSSRLPAVSPVFMVEVLGELVHAVAVRISSCLVAVGAALRLVGQRLGAVRAILRVQCERWCVYGTAGTAEVPG